MSATMQLTGNFHPEYVNTVATKSSGSQMQRSILVKAAYATMTSSTHVAIPRTEVIETMDNSKKTTVALSLNAPAIAGLVSSGAAVTYAGVGLVTKTLEKQWAYMLLFMALIIGCAFLVASLETRKTQERRDVR